MVDILKVGLIDDEQSALDNLKDILAQSTDFELGFATTNPEEGLKKAENGEVDILITDVMIPKLGGLEITERLGKTGIPILLCSAYDKFAVSGYQQDAVYFIMKPALYKDVSVGLERARKRLGKTGVGSHSSSGNIRIINSTGGITGEVIKVEEIDYLEQTGNYSNIHLGHVKKVIVSSLSNSLQRLDNEDIIQIHKSFAVNLTKIKVIHFTEIVLYNGKTIPIGKVYRDRLRNRLASKVF